MTANMNAQYSHASTVSRTYIKGENHQCKQASDPNEQVKRYVILGTVNTLWLIYILGLQFPYLFILIHTQSYLYPN